MEGELQNKKGRVIVRNLVFNLAEPHVKKLFEPYGEITEVNMPLNNANGHNKGFAFIQYKTRQDAVKAISALNGTSFKGRTIAVDLSVPKTVFKQYEKDGKPESKEEDGDSSIPKAEADSKPVVVSAAAKKDAKAEEKKTKAKKVEDSKPAKSAKPVEAAPAKKPKKAVDAKKPASGSEEKKGSDKKKDDKKDEKKDPKKEVKKEEKKLPFKKPNKFDDKTTLFIRNISFDTTEEEFSDYFATYGEINYAKLCMNPETHAHKGTGFVQYKNEDDAKNMLEMSQKAEACYDTKKAKRNLNEEESTS